MLTGVADGCLLGPDSDSGARDGRAGQNLGLGCATGETKHVVLRKTLLLSALEWHYPGTTPGIVCSVPLLTMVTSIYLAFRRLLLCPLHLSP